VGQEWSIWLVQQPDGGAPTARPCPRPVPLRDRIPGSLASLAGPVPRSWHRGHTAGASQASPWAAPPPLHRSAAHGVQKYLGAWGIAAAGITTQPNCEGRPEEHFNPRPRSEAFFFEFTFPKFPFLGSTFCSLLFGVSFPGIDFVGVGLQTFSRFTFLNVAFWNLFLKVALLKLTFLQFAFLIFTFLEVAFLEFDLKPLQSLL
jgi:hypothetical protein